MRGAVKYGTAAPADLAPLPLYVFGKTGTLGPLNAGSEVMRSSPRRCSYRRRAAARQHRGRKARCDGARRIRVDSGRASSRGERMGLQDRCGTEAGLELPEELAV